MMVLKLKRFKWTRLVMLLLILLLVFSSTACGKIADTKPESNSSANSKTPSPADAKNEWDKVVEAAKKEGKLIIASDPSELYRKVLLEEFEKKYPEIKIEYTGMNGRDFRPRLAQERKVGQYLWDLRVSGINPETYAMKDEGVFDPILPLVLPEVANESIWHGGFKYIFSDKEQKVFPTAVYFAEYRVMINRDFVTEAELDSLEKLNDPKFKGKISIQDPQSGGGLAAVTQLLKLYGEKFVQDLLTKQEIIITSDKRQQVDWLVRGKYPIALGLEQGFLLEFQKKGVGQNVIPVVKSQDDSLRVIHLINKAPHPNAAKVYINWILSQEGQKVMVKGFEGISMRKDVDPFEKTLVINPTGITHTRLYEENSAIREQAQELVKKFATK